MLLQLLGHQRLLLGFQGASELDLRVKKEEIVQVQEKLLEKVECSEELGKVCCRTCPNVLCLQLKTGESDEDEILVEEISPLQSGVSAVSLYSDAESTETSNCLAMRSGST